MKKHEKIIKALEDDLASIAMKIADMPYTDSNYAQRWASYHTQAQISLDIAKRAISE